MLKFNYLIDQVKNGNKKQNASALIILFNAKSTNKYGIQTCIQILRFMIKSTLWVTLIAVFLLQATTTKDTVVVITSNNTTRKPILDAGKLVQHIKHNQDLSNYIVDLTDAQQQAIKIAQDVLQAVGMKQQNVNSFISQTQQIKKTIQSVLSSVKQISAQELVGQLERNPESVVYFTKEAKSSRLLEQTQQVVPTNSQLFMNMTPGVLSGLFVGLFLIVVLLIGISCLWELKTNDKYATNNLFVGKQS